MVIVNCWDKFCTLGRAPRTKKTLPDFREWCPVTRHPRVFRRLTGCQQDTPGLGCHNKNKKMPILTSSAMTYDICDNVQGI